MPIPTTHFYLLVYLLFAVMYSNVLMEYIASAIKKMDFMFVCYETYVAFI